MSRPRKQQVDYLKAQAVALAVADWAGIARTGWAMARWFERFNNLEPGALDVKPWRLFFKGHHLQHSTFDQLLLICPQARDIYSHPLWTLLREDCNSVTRTNALKILGLNSRPKCYYSLKALQKHTALDRLAIFVATMGLFGNQGYQMYKDAFDSVAQLIIEREWHVMQEEFSNLVFGAIVSTGALDFEPSCYEVRSTVKFWRLIYAEYSIPRDRDREDVWFTWRCVIREMHWQNRLDLDKYLNAGDSREEAKFANGKKQLKRIQRKVYRCCPRVTII